MLGIIIDSISTFMYSKLLVILLIGAGIYFTIRTKLPQMRLFKDACKAVVEKPEDENGVSSFQALMVSTASIRIQPMTSSLEISLEYRQLSALEDLALYSGCGSLRSSEVHPH